MQINSFRRLEAPFCEKNAEVTIEIIEIKIIKK